MSKTLASTIEPPESAVDGLPCIYGADVKADCPVRKTLAVPSLASRIMPKDPALDAMKGFVDMAAAMVSSSIMGLVPFCEHCPFLDVFSFEIVERMSMKLEKEVDHLLTEQAILVSEIGKGSCHPKKEES